MPAVRSTKYAADFQDIPSDPTRVKCLVCSAASDSQDTIFLRSGRSEHLTRRKHVDAVAEQTRLAASSLEIPPAPQVTAAAPPARFKLSDILESDSEEDEDQPQRVPSPLDDIMMDGSRFFDRDRKELLFSAGTAETGAAQRRELLEGIRNLDYYDHTVFGKIAREDTTVSEAVAAMVDMDLNSDLESEPEYTLNDDAWSPHGSKTMFMLDLLDNLPRLRLSDDQLKTIIWVMRECKTPDVPSFNALRKKQAELTKDVNIGTRHHVSALGNEFFMNHQAELLALDFANPLVRKYMHVYPEITDRISEFNHAEKWTKEIDHDDLSPMWADWENSPHKHFYIKELAQLKNGEYFVPTRWVIFNKKECAEGHKSNCFVVHDDETVRSHASDLKYNYLDLKHAVNSITFTDSSPDWAQSMPNPVRKIAKGRPVFSVRIIPWSDDVSGNVSKQYNPHMNVYMANACLPHRKVSQEYFVRFCSTSPHASSGEQLEALTEDIGQYHEAYDCKIQQEILFRIFAHALPADNPQQAESASNAGVHSNLWCRYDMAGGTAAHRETNEGYGALFKPGNPRTPAATVRTIKRQIWAACTGVRDAVDEFQTSTGVKDKTALFWIEKLILKARELQQERFKTDPRLKDKKIKGDARKAIKIRIKDHIQWQLYSWVLLQPADRVEKLPRNSADRWKLRPGDHFNVLLRVRGLDPHRDGPCEILHTVLLGDDKYIWHETHTPWDKSKADKFAVRLQSSLTDGLNNMSLRARYIVKYKNGLIGKHFKILQQLGIFHLHNDLCGDNLFNLWKAAGELGALLWFPEIRNQAQYLADLQICIDNLLDLWALVDPARIMTKYKLHVLSHLPDDIRRFGPAILFATEGFECWNTIFRLCSILSNHQAPSHDIAVTLADMERFKHQVSGGWWKATDSQSYTQAGRKVRTFLENNKELQRRLGWTDKMKPKPGTTKLAPRRTSLSAQWAEILGPIWTPELNAYGAGKVWTTCKFVVAQSGDVCAKDSFVFFKCKDTGEVLTGRICMILIPATATTSHDQAAVVIRKFVVAAERDSRLNMPRMASSVQMHVVTPADVLFCFNAQHDCYTLKCPIVAGAEPVIHERISTRQTQAAVQHIGTEAYIINLHALHNANLLRDTLPRNLTAPVPLYPDRDAKRDEYAAILRVSGPAKRAAAAKKSQETRQKNKEARAAKQGQGGVRLEELEPEEEEEGRDEMEE
ncbi:hypothetical protein R3P38DRAFT_3452826 [Favolaschia claudopus]|uniref:Uncharacterized protein n=1 Tax=Favolaschia claudopus TaxID=2862362 RepID=A0AAW0CQM2_9AGAR